MSTARRLRIPLGLLLVVIAMMQVTASPTTAQTTPLFGMRQTGTGYHLFTTNEAERKHLLSYGYVDVGIIGSCLTRAVTGSVPLHRLVGAFAGIGIDNFYTTDGAEANRAVSQFGYVKKGVECYVWKTENERSIPLYRLYRNGGVHFYTTDNSARAKHIAEGYTDEGITGFLESTRAILSVGAPGGSKTNIGATTPPAPGTTDPEKHVAISGKNQAIISSGRPAVRGLSRRMILGINEFVPSSFVEGRPGRLIVSVENASGVPISGYLSLGVDGTWGDRSGHLPDLQPRQKTQLELALPAMTVGTHHIGVRYEGCAAGPACPTEIITADELSSTIEVRRRPLDRLFPLVATLYKDVNFQGSQRVVVGDIGDLEYQGFNDLSSSIVIQPGPDYAAWKQAHGGAEPVLQLFRDAFFTGGSRALAVGSYPDIDASFGIPDQISSVRYAPDDVPPDESPRRSDAERYCAERGCATDRSPLEDGLVNRPKRPDQPADRDLHAQPAARNDLPVIVTVFATALSTCGVVPRGYSDLEIAGGYVLFGWFGPIIGDMKANKCPRFHYHAWIIDDVSDLGSLDMFNDAISAARVDRGPTYNDEAVFFFADAGCRGAYIKQEKATINDTMPKDILTWMSTITGGPYPENVKGSLVDEAFNDRISSIHIGPTANCGR